MDRREEFLRHVCLMVDYWDSDYVGKKTTRERLEGLAFSIMVALDGGAGDLPAYLVLPVVEKLERLEVGGSGNLEGTIEALAEEDISGSLHEVLSDMLRAFKEGKRPDLSLPRMGDGQE